MSFRELRNFTEMLRELDFPRQVSIDNFRQPNFPLVAEVLLWVVKRIDASAILPTDIEDEADRVLFVKAIAQFMATKLHLRLNTKRMYEANGHAVKELIKATSILHTALKAQSSEDSQEEILGPPVSMSDFSITDKLGELKKIRELAADITARGASLFELLGSEVQLREDRNDALAKGLDIGELEAGVRESINSVAENVQKTIEMMDNIASDEKQLESKLKSRKEEIERSQKRLKSLKSVRPAFMDEYEKYEADLSKVYEEYVEKFRNLSFLEQELEAHNRAEQDKLEESETQLKQMQSRMRMEELRMLRGTGELNGDLDDEDDDLDDLGLDESGEENEDSDADLETEHRVAKTFGGMDANLDSEDEDSDDISGSIGEGEEDAVVSEFSDDDF
eukprot:m.137592 g.137592  ORF g.137592 m.137592 type:complete len:393 (-) comp11998_c0_seq1:213-1391(-)